MSSVCLYCAKIGLLNKLVYIFAGFYSFSEVGPSVSSALEVDKGEEDVVVNKLCVDGTV